MARKTPVPPTSRSDILPTSDEALSKALMAASEKPVRHLDAGEQIAEAKADDRFAQRMSLAENKDSDPHGYERIIGISDLMSVNYFERGRRAANAVCRIVTPVPGGAACGTGFLVGPRLLLTNNHVLPNANAASQSDVEFEYELDMDGVEKQPVRFNLRPNELFYTSTALDFTFVAVAPLAEDGTPIEKYGRLPLLPVSGKAIGGEWVTIIQHPDGRRKEIAIRANQIVQLEQKQVPGVDLERFIHYLTDTEPGSSGSPVLNDQWGVVALHHKGVPAPGNKRDSKGNRVFIANEGVRVSAIYERLERARFENDSAAAVLERLSKSLGLPPARPIDIPQTEQYAPLPAKAWESASRLGYDPNFLSGDGAGLKLEDMLAPALAKGLDEDGIVAPLKDGAGFLLDYLHFSVAMHRKRRFALLTAVNIDGKRLVHPGKRADTWRLDDRMDRAFQSDDNFYLRSKGEEKVYFSRGHLVRLLDPCWGDSNEEARMGMMHSFHFTNAAPQFQAYNDADWGNLEDYVLERAQTTERRMTVLTGPIFRESDPFYGTKRKGGPWQIPMSYWKIAILQKSRTRIGAAAFIVGQTEHVKALYEAKVFSGLKPYTVDDMRAASIQTTVRTVSEESGLDFSMLEKFDAQGTLESTQQTRWINHPSELLI